MPPMKPDVWLIDALCRDKPSEYNKTCWPERKSLDCARSCSHADLSQEFHADRVHADQVMLPQHLSRMTL